ALTGRTHQVHDEPRQGELPGVAAAVAVGIDERLSRERPGGGGRRDTAILQPLDRPALPHPGRAGPLPSTTSKREAFEGQPAHASFPCGFVELRDAKNNRVGESHPRPSKLPNSLILPSYHTASGLQRSGRRFSRQG